MDLSLHAVGSDLTEAGLLQKKANKEGHCTQGRRSTRQALVIGSMPDNSVPICEDEASKLKQASISSFMPGYFGQWCLEFVRIPVAVRQVSEPRSGANLFLFQADSRPSLRSRL